jgi:hypothetical protein
MLMQAGRPLEMLLAGNFDGLGVMYIGVLKFA